MSRPGEPNEAQVHHPYCLRCYAAMEHYGGARHVCERCGFVNLKLDQELFWTKEKRFRDLEELAKTLIVLVLVGVTVVLGLGVAGGPGIGTGQGWAVGFPILFAVILWETASKITRRKPYFRPAIVWRIVFLILGPPATYVGAMMAARHGAWLVLLAAGLAMLFGALAIGRWVRGLAAWRDRHIRAGQTAEA